MGWLGVFFKKNCPIFPLRGKNETHRELTSLSHFQLYYVKWDTFGQSLPSV